MNFEIEKKAFFDFCDLSFMIQLVLIAIPVSREQYEI